jgi:biopolymer transport protein ExbD
MRFSLSPVTRLLLCSWLCACGGDKPASEAAASGPIVGVLELPISLRTGGAAPADFHDVEISPTEVHVAGLPVITLASGAVTPADRQGAALPKLSAALSKTPHARLALAVAAAVPYDTVSLVLATAKAAGVRSVAFKVRPHGGGSTTGWLTLDALDVGPKSKTDQAVAFEGLAVRPWSDFANKWDDVQSACRASPTGSCAFKPSKVAEGGDLKIVLHSAGQGVNVDFFRIGDPPPEAAAPAAPPEKPGKLSKASKASKKKAGKKHKPELIDGVKATDVVAEVEEAPPATEALFQFRAQEAVTSPSAVSETLKPVCGSASCGVVVQAEKATLFVRMLSLLGAAFPDGTPTPRVVFELP